MKWNTRIEPLGESVVGGRRLYRIQIQLDEITEPIETSLPAEDLTLVAQASSKAQNGQQD